jgi:hypothetical protein
MNSTSIMTTLSLVFIGGILLVQLWFNTFAWETLAKIIITYVVVWGIVGVILLLRQKQEEKP